ncbi:MAG: diacylglycerol kinase family lipid kinase [Anaerolineae bacterium]|nr:MAG: diacylglycerol kinase family lipid kinase [Anaerolineae bacterium]
MKTTLIINPKANHGQAAQVTDTIISLVKDYINPEVIMTEGPGHAVEVARNAVDQGVELLVSVGGDGTVHEIVNGMVVGGITDTTLGVVPIGSGNDLAFGLGISNDINKAVSIIFKGKKRRIDLARIEDDRGRFEVVTNGIGIGFDATITIQSRTITRVHGFTMYLLAVLRTIALYFQAPKVRILFDDERIEQNILLLAIGLGRRVGGGFFLTPDANHEDDLLDSCTIDPVSRYTMLALLPRVMRGTHTTSKFVKMRRSHLIDIKSESPLPVHVDGEIFAFPDDDVRQLTVTSLAKALPIMVPED